MRISHYEASQYAILTILLLLPPNRQKYFYHHSENENITSIMHLFEPVHVTSGHWTGVHILKQKPSMLILFVLMSRNNSIFFSLIKQY